MRVWLYSLALFLYQQTIKFAALFHAKAKLMWEGQQKTWEKLPQGLESRFVVWFHAASLGEFEQGRPLIEAYREQHPDHFILLSFFSPSGYEIRKQYDKADLVVYLPLDSRKNAARFLNLVQPHLAIFVKYEFWYFYLNELHQRKVPTLLVSAIFRENSPFFGIFGGFFRHILSFFTKMYLQNERSAALLAPYGISNVEVVGDTRFDRVHALAQQIEPWALKETFVQGKPFAVAGSVWEADMEVLIPLINKDASDLRWIIAPHEMHVEEMKRWEQALNGPVAYSKGSSIEEIEQANVLIVNEFGRLSSLYAGCSYAYIGGSFGAGLHNTLEAAVFGPPIFFGNKKYEKFQEAVDLRDLGIAFPVANYRELSEQFNQLQQEETLRLAIQEKSLQFVAANKGASEKIMSYINQLQGWKKA